MEKSHLDCIEVLLNALKLSIIKKSQSEENLLSSSSSFLTSNELNSLMLDSSQNGSFNSMFIDSNGENPLHYAARLNDMNICNLLISNGFDLNLKSIKNEYPHELCTNESLKAYLFGNLLFSLLFLVK